MAEKLRVGVIGLGRAGHKMHFKELDKFAELYEIVAGCDHDEERRKAAAEAKPSIKLYESVDEILKDQDIDMITVATRSPDHVAHAIAALEAGKYVVCEKPIAVCYWDALKLKAAADKFPGKLFIRQNRRFEKAFSHIREILATGILGNVYEFKIRRHNYQWRPDWQTILDCGGGQLLNWGPHIIDQAVQFLQSPVESVWSDLKLVAALGDAEDHLKVVLRGTNGRIVDLEISGGVAIGEPIYCIHGSLGTLVCKDEKTIQLKYYKAEERPTEQANPGNPPLEGGFGAAKAPNWIQEEFPVEPASGNYPERCWEYIYNAINGGKPYEVTIDEAIENVRITDIVKAQSPIQDVR